MPEYQDDEQAVREAAYFLWENAGSPVGRDMEFWLQALEAHLGAARDEDSVQAEPRPTHQVDDNIDDLGKPVSESQ